MQISLIGLKGGVGKSTIAVNLAACLAESNKVLLVDGDANQSAMQWCQGGEMGFECLDIQSSDLDKALKSAEHVVIDTQGGAPSDDLQSLAKSCDLCILPTFPDALALSALLKTTALMSEYGANYRVLVNQAPPRTQPEGDDALEFLDKHKIPTFRRMVRGAKAFKKAALEGVAVRDLKGDRNAGNCWRDIVFLAREVLNESV